MSKATRPRIAAPADERAEMHAPAMRAGHMPYSAAWLRKKAGTYAFGTVVCGAVMVTAAAWMGGSLGSFGKRMGEGVDVMVRAAGLSVERVNIVGLEPIVEQRAREAAMVEPGESMLAADPYAIRTRIEQLDAVGGVSVHRLWPDQITIIAETREPIALWRDGAGWRVIDQHGKTFAQVDPDAFIHLPRVSGRNGAEAASALLLMMSDYPELARRMKTAKRVGDRRWDVTFHGGVEVALPEDGRLDEALGALNFLQAQNRLLELPLTRIDARHPERFALQPTPGAPALGGA
ncbi:MAG: cell division protein FtsQ/DivIB [Alphaproteobacteria bacterium]|nr:cell division protein FtsQ/DivIB [Alphaproteobacteria bacterium]